MRDIFPDSVGEDSLTARLNPRILGLAHVRRSVMPLFGGLTGMRQTGPCHSLSDYLPDPRNASSGTNRHIPVEPALIALVRLLARQTPVAASPIAPSATPRLRRPSVILPGAGSGVGGSWS